MAVLWRENATMVAAAMDRESAAGAVLAADRLLLLQSAKLSTLYEASTQPRRKRYIFCLLKGVDMTSAGSELFGAIGGPRPSPLKPKLSE